MGLGPGMDSKEPTPPTTTDGTKTQPGHNAPGQPGEHTTRNTGNKVSQSPGYTMNFNKDTSYRPANPNESSRSPNESSGSWQGFNDTSRSPGSESSGSGPGFNAGTSRSPNESSGSGPGTSDAVGKDRRTTQRPRPSGETGTIDDSKTETNIPGIF